ncbi:MAG TPA: cobalt-precorrin 5A hydrolase [Candidatus Blautia intestinigallinarum]|nr:cobalt-precorrin 5A hydrolase [Candidatus Blautia intestinigallinarum]
MKKMGIISFSLTGAVLSEKLEVFWKNQGWQVENVSKSVYLPTSVQGSLREWTGRQFEECEAVIFIGACGIAVRSVAPFVKSKKTDPAVLVIDECQTFVISLLSGHLGGANDLAREAAKFLGAAAVVTTATDLHGRFAVDVFAKKNGCEIFPMTAAKAFSAALLAGETVGFYSDFPWTGELPKGFVLVNSQEQRENPAVGMALTVRRDCEPFAQTVRVVPKAVTVGLGCRKGTKEEAIDRLVLEALDENGIWPQALWKAASVDLKKEEAGIHSWCHRRGIPFETYPAEALLKVPGEFTASEFVRKTTGVENVCERSAVLAGGDGRLIQRKKAGDGVTCALVLSDWSVCFE